MLPLEFSEIRDAIATANPLLLATDFDGTLCPIASTPEIVRTDPRMLLALRRLAASPKVVLAVLSGRALSDVQSRLDVDAIFAGNHGLEIARPGCRFIHPEAERFATYLTSVCDRVSQAIASLPGAWVENKRLTATVHLRACRLDRWAPVMKAVQEALEPVQKLFSLRSGRAALEISPKIGWDKGSALKYLQRELGLLESPVLCIGDDETDESMFRSFPSGLSIRVCPEGSSAARYSLLDVSAVTDLFEKVAETVGATARVHLGYGRHSTRRSTSSGLI